jgi:hypothetical protein
MKNFALGFLCLLTETREATAIPTMGFLRWCWEAITTGMVEMMETTMEV